MSVYDGGAPATDVAGSPGCGVRSESPFRTRRLRRMNVCAHAPAPSGHVTRLSAGAQREDRGLEDRGSVRAYATRPRLNSRSILRAQRSPAYCRLHHAARDITAAPCVAQRGGVVGARGRKNDGPVESGKSSSADALCAAPFLRNQIAVIISENDDDISKTT